MKLYFFLIVVFVCKLSAGQQIKNNNKGNYFTTNKNDYFEKTFKPWKYHYIPNTDTLVTENKHIGTIIFWRSEPIITKSKNEGFKPYISFQVYTKQYFNWCASAAFEVFNQSNCAHINKGGTIISVGNFILLNATSCVNCSSDNSIDYCRAIVKKIMQNVEDTKTNNWNEILNQLMISSKKNKELADSLGLNNN